LTTPLDTPLDIARVEGNISTSEGHLTQHRLGILGGGSALYAPFDIVETS
jgi:hypothetical protein